MIRHPYVCRTTSHTSVAGVARGLTNAAEGMWWRILVVGRFMTTSGDTIGDSTIRAHETDQGVKRDAGQRTRRRIRSSGHKTPQPMRPVSISETDCQRLGAPETAPTEHPAELLGLAASSRLQLAR